MRRAVNDYFKNAEPFKLITKSFGSAVALFVVYRFITLARRKGLKQLLFTSLVGAVKFVPGAEKKISQEKDKLVAKLEHALAFNDPADKHLIIPKAGVPGEELLRQMRLIKELEEPRWKDGKVSGCVYIGDEEHQNFINEAYSLFSLTNPLHPDVFPSIRKFEAEIVRMCANMLGGDSNACGAMTSGGTESLLMAIKTYRDWARATKGITDPEMIVPESAHAAFDKASHYFGVKIIHVPVGTDFRADVAATRKAITRNTICLVASAPSFPHGMIDPVVELAKLAKEHKIGLHVDACLGGFLLPWMKKLGYPIRPFDFSAHEAVTSMSVDTHKYGFAPKGTSVILFRNNDLRRHMYSVFTEWPGGIYCSPTMAGSRPGGLIAGCWAAITSLGEEGYLRSAEAIARAATRIRKEIPGIPGMFVLGEPDASVVAFSSKEFDIFKIVDALNAKGWSLNALHRPNCLHICVTMRHVDKVDVLLGDLREAAENVRRNPEGFKEVSPMYGLAATLPDRGLVGEFISSYLDVVLKAN